MKEPQDKKKLLIYIEYLKFNRDKLSNFEFFRHDSRVNLNVLLVALYAISISIAIPNNQVTLVNIIFGIILLIKIFIESKEKSFLKLINKLDLKIEETYKKYFSRGN